MNTKTIYFILLCVIITSCCTASQKSKYESQANSKDPSVRSGLAIQLGDVPPDETTLNILAKLLSDENDSVRFAAGISANKTGSPTLAPHLVPLLWDTDIDLVNVAIVALERIGRKHEIPSVLDAIEQHHDNEGILVTLFARLTELTHLDWLDFYVEDSMDRKKYVLKCWREWWRIEGSVAEEERYNELFELTPSEASERINLFGGKKGMPVILRMLDDKWLNARFSAINLLFAITNGETFSYNPRSDNKGRQTSINKWKTWWSEVRDYFHYDENTKTYRVDNDSMKTGKPTEK